MQTKEKEILVYADWYMFASPKLVGCIYFASLRGKGVYSFEYDKEWLKIGIAIDPELPLFAGKHYASSNENFGVFKDASPDRAGIATSTLGNIEEGSPSVSLGNYLQVLSILRLEDDLLLLADKDPIGRQIQDAGLIVRKRAPKTKKVDSVIESNIDKGNSDVPEFE